MNNSETQGTEKTDGAITNEQSRDRKRQNRRDNQ